MDASLSPGRVALATLALLWSSKGAGAQAGRLEVELPDLLREAQVPGLGAALADATGVTWTGAFGLRDAERELPVDDETVFAAASLSKPVFAYVVLRLVDEETLELDRPLVEYAPVPDLAHDRRHARLTARMVLAHTTGLPNWRPRGGRLEFVADPGTRFGYSGEGFELLTRVVEEHLGMELEELAHELVFEPLGMTRSSFLREPGAEGLALPHDERGQVLESRARPPSAAASLVCTATDYATFLAALLRGEGLSPEIVEEMRRPQVQVAPGVSWGLGLGIEEQEEGPAFWQWGHNDGHRAFAWLSPARDRAFVFLSNGEGGMLLLRDVLRLATEVDHHPAVDHLAYESWDSPAHTVRRVLEDALARGDAGGVLAVYDTLRHSQTAEAFGEELLNRLGYSLLNAEPPRVADAVALFRKNVELYPRAFNPWDSLGEGLVAAGRPAEALAAYERSVELEPSNAAGVAAIARLRAELASSPVQPADAAPGPADGENDATKEAAAIAAYLDAWEQRGELSGVVLAARGDAVLFRRAYGLADVEHGIPNTPETVFHVASVTKTFTAAAVLLLEDAGELTLADPLSRFLPGYPRGDEITLTHLLGHASGIPDHHGLPGFEDRTAQGIPLAELVQWQSEFPLEYAPGTSSRYANSGYAVLAHVVELVSESAFPDFLLEEILEPLGMEATGEVGADEDAPERARGYWSGPPPSSRIAVPRRDYSYAMGSGSLCSSADDLLRWLRAVDTRALVDVQRTPWPYGWGRQRYGRFQALEQTGAHAGFTATVTVVPAAHVHVVHLSNLQAGLPFQRVHRDVTRILLGEEVVPPQPLEPVPWDPEDGARFAGTYDAGLEWQPTLTADARGLWWTWNPGQPAQYLRPLGEDRFLLVADGCELVFARGPTASPPRFELHEPWNPEGPAATYVRMP